MSVAWILILGVDVLLRVSLISSFIYSRFNCHDTVSSNLTEEDFSYFRNNLFIIFLEI